MILLKSTSTYMNMLNMLNHQSCKQKLLLFLVRVNVDHELFSDITVLHRRISGDKIKQFWGVDDLTSYVKHINNEITDMKRL